MTDRSNLSGSSARGRGLRKAINSWVRVQTVQLQGSADNSISVLNDLNHVPLDRALTVKEMNSYLDNALDEISKILIFYKYE